MPNNYTFQGGSGIKFTSNAKISYGYLHNRKLKSDLDFLVSCYQNSNFSENEKNIFARNAIILMAFYFECLSSTLFTTDDISWESITKNYSHNSKSVRKFIAKLLQSNIGTYNLDHSGIQDLFFIRNKTFAHAPEETILASSDASEVTTLAYAKYLSFPHSYIDFGVEQADTLLLELDRYLTAYTSLMKSILPEWWVNEYTK